MQDHPRERLRTGHILGNPASSPKQSGALQEQGAHARGLVASRRRSIPESDLNPIGTTYNQPRFPHQVEMNVRTPSISRASTTLTQSRSDILNAVQGICFTRRLSRRTVVIGPYIWSADVTNKPIGFEVNHVSILAKQIKNWQYLTKFVCLVKHLECCSPVNIAV